MIRNSILIIIVCSNLLISHTRSNLRFTCSTLGGVLKVQLVGFIAQKHHQLTCVYLLVHIFLAQFRLQLLHGQFFVLDLRSFGLTFYGHTAGKMNDPDCTVRRVNVLTTSSTSLLRFDFQVFWL